MCPQNNKRSNGGNYDNDSKKHRSTRRHQSERGENKYGDVKFADTTNNKYPIDTEEHVRAAWNYINHKDNAAKYDNDEVELIKNRIKKAAKHHGVEIAES